MSQGVPAHGMAYVMPGEPSTWEVYQHLLQQNERRRLQEEQKQKEAEAHENALLQYMTKEWDDKEIDGLLHDQLRERKNFYAEQIRKNPGMSMVDLATMMQRDLSEINKWNQAVKQGRSLIDQQGEDYKKYDNLKYNRAKQIALENMLYDNKDGVKTLRSYKDFDLEKDYFDEALNQFPDELWKDRPTMETILKGVQTQKVGDGYSVTNSKGGRTAKKFTADIYPFQEVITDKSGEKHVRTRGVEIEGVKDRDGNPAKMATDDDYRWFLSRRDQKALVDSEFRKYNREVVAAGGKPISENSEEANIFKRRLVYDILDSKSPKSIVRDYQQKENPAPRIYVYNSNGQEDPQATESVVSVLTGALKDERYDAMAPSVEVPQDEKGLRSKTHKDLLPILGDNVKLAHPSGGPAVKPNNILYDPNNRQWGYWVTYDEKGDNGTVQEKTFRIDGSNLRNWLLSSNRAMGSGTNFAKPDSEVNRYVNKQGQIRSTPLQKAINRVRRSSH